ncbi:MAG TPA: type III secretion system export apparatus subunit SctS [Thiolinea sp.]|nr:type III secretion system export apparatus subunit SctS [Thiolinea sp.]
MNENSLLHFTSQAMQLVLYLSLPSIAAATLVGLLIGLFQALTSIQEQTLPHGFKLVAVIFAIAATIRWFGPELYSYTIQVFDQVTQLKGSG